MTDQAFTSFDDIPNKRYGLIMADPNWQFKARSDKGYNKSPQKHYDCASTQDICDLNIEQIAADDCLLWLWATNPMLPDALEVMKAWGFTFKTVGSWVKMSSTWTPRARDQKLAFGTGYILRSSNEPFLIGTRGAVKTVSKSVPSAFRAAVREHSRKPNQAYWAAKLLCPDVPAIDLFARERREGWDIAGWEVDKFGGIS